MNKPRLELGLMVDLADKDKDSLGLKGFMNSLEAENLVSRKEAEILVIFSKSLKSFLEVREAQGEVQSVNKLKLRERILW